jgi:hypothetical protein
MRGDMKDSAALGFLLAHVAQNKADALAAAAKRA